jgi:hypothetical protein
LQLIRSQKSDDCGLKDLVLQVATDRWFSRRMASHEGGTDQELILVNVYDPQNMITYEWCSPNLRSIVAGENLLIIGKLLKEDILNYLR